VKVFSALAAVSFLFAVYWKYSFAALSYSVWADERGIALPERFVDSDLSCAIWKDLLMMFKHLRRQRGFPRRRASGSSLPGQMAE